jgi:hypothetical protein
MGQFADFEQSSLQKIRKNEFLLVFAVLKTLILGSIALALLLTVILTCMITDLVSFLLSTLVRLPKRTAEFKVLME